jgi:membrane protein DedA with SNARE-associated domain
MLAVAGGTAHRRHRQSSRCIILAIPTDLASFLDLIRQHGDAAYAILFAYAASHSLLVALFAGYAASSGALSFATLVTVFCIGSFTGDAVRFWIGRHFGVGWLNSLPKLQRAVRIAAQLADRHHVWMIQVHRYPHGIRSVAGFAYGMSPLAWPAFLAHNFLAAAVWACASISAGYAFGHVSEKVMSDASSGLGAVMLIAFLGLSWVLSRKLERALEQR